MNIEFISKVCASLYYIKDELNLQHNPMFYWKKSKTTLKIYGIKLESMVFYYKYLQLLLFSKLCVSKSPSLFQNLSFGGPYHDSKPTIIQNSN